jgi:polar amino acid transport system substrate-binding protein
MYPGSTGIMSEISKCHKIIALVMLFAVHITAFASEPLKLAVFEYPPFLTQARSDFGIEPAIVRSAFEQVGVTVEFSFYPAARALEKARQGHVDGTLGWVHSSEREQAFFYSETIATAPLVFFHMKTRPVTWKNYDDLKSLRIGTVNKYFYGTDFHQAQASALIQVDAVTDDALNLKKLVAGRIDLTPINLYVGYYLARQIFDTETASEFTHSEQALRVSEHHLLLPRCVEQSNVRLSQFNRGLEAIKQNGHYQVIMDRYSQETDQKTLRLKTLVSRLGDK